MSAALWERLAELSPQIEAILETSGSPGLSLGVLHQGGIVHTAHFGRRDIDTDEAPNDDTVYHVASLTKAITASTVASLVDSGTLDWDLPVRHYVPEFGQRDDELGRHGTLKDLLSNRTGLALSNALWGQKEGEFLLPRSEIIPTICQMGTMKPLRDSFVYSQWNYALVTEIVEKVTGKSFGRCVKDRILDPLGMDRTTFNPEEGDNVALPYALLDNATPHRIALTNLSDETGLAGTVAARSSIRNLLSFYRALLAAYSQGDCESTKLNPLKQARAIFTPHIAIGGSDIENKAYCLGLYRTKLPNNIGYSSMNNILIGPKKMPVAQSTSPGLQVYHHTGNVPGFVASAFLVPSSQSAIVVLTNALPLMDPTDFVGQLVLSRLLGQKPPSNLLELSKLGRSASILSYGALNKQLQKHKTTKLPTFPLDTYEGHYFNVAGNFKLVIRRQSQSLIMNVQDLPLTKYELLPYDGDTFYWPANRDVEVKQCMWPLPFAGYHKIQFAGMTSGSIDRLIWQHDPFAKPEVFKKKASQASKL
ncbi:uncharacterized protein KY384_003587 [Bacidia gigantensis]|uniref:uncharacterized protein n=1 Tax=Bacidia gigantensis TaxID=2732470 RepID=UPI001D04208C|nr:uncharacterized protein KY384_003587 [Bacidia gigantensis]KAG8531951.1 hypothetical protein KY384_003587 [Bacidia gigantensis]